MNNDRYLAADDFIDWTHPAVRTLAGNLAGASTAPVDIGRNCFEFVRDQIRHSWDYELNPVTCKASQVLEAGTGYCFAKSHLLAALLRANGIPAGLCYQRLSMNGDGAPFCLHGLNAVFLPGHGWYRVDARGDTATVSTAFDPPQERIAYAITCEGEADLPEIRERPLDIVVEVLQRAVTFDEVARNLPDLEIVVPARRA